MADTLQFDLVSPERNMASGQASQVIAPGVEGDIGFLPGHAPFITTLRPGVLTVTMDGKDSRYAVFGGFVEAGPEQVAVLADDVHLLEELDDAVLDDRIARTEQEAATADPGESWRFAQRLLDLRALKDAKPAAG